MKMLYGIATVSRAVYLETSVHFDSRVRIDSSMEWSCRRGSSSLRTDGFNLKLFTDSYPRSRNVESTVTASRPHPNL